jgi:hypothetical protein
MKSMSALHVTWDGDIVLCPLSPVRVALGIQRCWHEPQSIGL